MVQIGAALAQLETETRPVLAYGGIIFNLLPELRARVNGVFLGENAAHAIDNARALLVAH